MFRQLVPSVSFTQFQLSTERNGGQKSENMRQINICLYRITESTQRQIKIQTIKSTDMLHRLISGEKCVLNFSEFHFQLLISERKILTSVVFAKFKQQATLGPFNFSLETDHGSLHKKVFFLKLSRLIQREANSPHKKFSRLRIFNGKTSI